MRAVLIIVLFIFGVACAPSQVIRPYPNFVQAGIKVGDRVTIETKDGRALSFKVTTIDGNGITGSGETITYPEIQTISKRAWRRPNFPCGGEKPLGCSIPQLLTLINGVTENTDAFEPSCIQHDFCYRHGAATYGRDRTACDDEFRANLKQQCQEPKWLTAISLTLNKKRCLFVANQMYRAVRRHGQGKFQSNDSSYCEYDGPEGTLSTSPMTTVP